MRKIPAKHRKLIDKDPFFKQCCKCGRRDVQIHHVFTYAGKQISEMFNYVPACVSCHKKATPHASGRKYDPEIRHFFEWVALQRMTYEDLFKYNKYDWGNLVLFINKEAINHNC